MPQKKNDKLWKEGYELPIIAITGDYGSGKSTFPFLIGGNVRDFDFEKGSEQLAGQFKQHYTVDRIDMVDIATNGAPHELFVRFSEMVDELDWDGIDIAVIDTGTRLEESAKAHVSAFPNLYGVTPGQIQKQTGLDWSLTKKALEKLFTKITSKVQTLVIVMHLRTAYQDGKPVPGKKEPRGLETISQLASLYLWMHRTETGTKVVGGKKVPLSPHFPKPSAEVLKSRLNHTTVNDKGEIELIPVLPKFLPIATPAEIRRYIDNPVTFDQYSDDEREADFVPDRDEDPEAKAEREADRQRIQTEAHVHAAKQSLIADMTAKFPEFYPDQNAIGAALVAMDLEYDYARDSEIRALLAQYAEAEPV